MVQGCAVLVEQHTLDEALDRAERIQRLARSLERWRAQGIDQILPNEYGYYCQLLDHLKGGKPYTVRDVAAEIVEEAGRAIGRGAFWRRQ